MIRQPARRYRLLFPKALAQIVEPLTRPLLKAHGLAGSRLLTEWPQVVGSALARHTSPEKLSFPRGKKTEGTLAIAVENGFATEVQHLQPVILERLNAYFGYQAVTRIAISHAWLPAAETPKTAPRRTALPAESLSLAENVADGELKDALTSLARTLSGKSTST